MKEITDFFQSAGVIIGGMILCVAAMRKFLVQVQEGWHWSKHKALIPEIYRELDSLRTRVDKLESEGAHG